MLSAITFDVDLLGMMTSTTRYDHLVLAMPSYLYCMMTIAEAALVNRLDAILDLAPKREFNPHGFFYRCENLQKL
jgi:hypothetical protein